MSIYLSHLDLISQFSPLKLLYPLCPNNLGCPKFWLHLGHTHSFISVLYLFCMDVCSKSMSCSPTRLLFLASISPLALRTLIDDYYPSHISLLCKDKGNTGHLLPRLHGDLKTWHVPINSILFVGEKQVSHEFSCIMLISVYFLVDKNDRW